MTPQERQSVSELFDRLAQLENTPRDAEAERAIADGLMRAPHAVYALVQTTLVQDEALRRADARIRELSSNAEPRANGSFFESMRTAVSGSSPHTSVPSVRPAANQPDARWNSGGAMAAAAAPASTYAPAPGGSFVGTAAASAAGMIGGALLLNSISAMFGHRSGNAFADVPPAGSPSDNNPRNSELARDAGLNDIGSDRQAGLFDSGDADNGDSADFGGDLGGDFGGDDSA